MREKFLWHEHGLYLPWGWRNQAVIDDVYLGSTLFDLVGLPRGTNPPKPYNKLQKFIEAFPHSTVKISTVRTFSINFVCFSPKHTDPEKFVNFIQGSRSAKRQLHGFLESCLVSLTRQPPLQAGPEISNETQKPPASRKRLSRSCKDTGDVSPSSSPPRKKHIIVPTEMPPTLASLTNALHGLPPRDRDPDSERSDKRDLDLLANCIKKLRSSTKGQKKLYLLLGKELGLQSSELEKAIANGAKEIVEKTSVSAKGGRPPKESTAALHVIAAAMVLGSESGDLKDDKSRKACLALGQQLGLSKSSIRGGISAASLMRIENEPYRQVDNVMAARRLAENEKNLVEAYQQFLHDENLFHTDTNMKDAHVNWERQHFTDTLGNGDIKSHHMKVGGEFHVGRSRGSLTDSDICDPFRRSLYYRDCNRGKAVWNVDKTRKHMCRCIKTPVPMACVDGIKANAKYSCSAINQLCSRIISGDTGSRRICAIQEL